MNSSSLKRQASDCVLNPISKFFKPISTEPKTSTIGNSTSLATRIESNDIVNCEETNRSFDPAQGQNTYEFNKEPIQPRITFPTTNHRHFIASWYDDYKWLEYSIGRNKAFCHTCRVFAVCTQSLTQKKIS